MTADDADDNQVSAVDGTGAPLKDQDLRRISLVRPELAQSKAGVRIGTVRIGGAVTHGGALLQPPDGDSSMPPCLQACKGVEDAPRPGK